MGNDIMSWRAAIGNFYCCCQPIALAYMYKASFNFIYLLLSGLMYMLNIVAGILKYNINTPSFNNLLVSIILLLLLLLAGDVEINPGPDNETGSLSVLHLNIRSIRNKLSYIEEELTDFDILCFTETHLSDRIETSSLQLKGYGLPYRKDKTPHSGGILVYVADHLLSYRMQDLEIFWDEIIWIQIKTQSEEYFIGTIYRPPASSVEFWELLNRNLEYVIDRSARTIMVGDLNEDQLNINNHKLKDIMIMNSLKNIITSPTRISAHTSTLLDPIVVNQNQAILKSDVLSVHSNISDHMATCVIIPAGFSYDTSFTRLVWNYKRADFDKFNNLIAGCDWTILNNGSVDEASDYFTSKFKELAKQCIPSKLVTIRPNDKPWYDSEIRRISKLRDKLRKKAIQFGRAEDWVKFKTLRNKVNNMKKHARESFYNDIEFNLTESFSNNKRNFWKLVRLFVKESKSSGTIPPLKTNDGNNDNFVYSDIEKANCLNDFFVSISSVDDSNIALPAFYSKTNISIDMIVINESEVSDVLKILQTNKACGNDLISHRMLKGTVTTVSKPLATIFNRSINESQYPSAWKLANVIPLFKKGCAQTPSNYRPISLLSCVGKVMERIMFKHIYNHTEQLIYNRQSGFLPGHSTVYQLIDIYHQICQSFDNRQFTCMVFCDISKAFDRVWHKGILFKLQQNGINGIVLNWIENYLTGRKQSVTMRSTASDIKTVTAGVPQGSVLGPLLFLIYINDITENLLSIARLFADDSSLSVTTSNVEDLEGIINHDLLMISNWSKQWLVNFNPNKTEAMIFTLRQLDNPINLMFDNTPVIFVNDHKHIGLTLSNNGKWHTHVNNIIESTSKVLGIMRHLKFKIGRKALNQIYVSYMRPILEYASVVWDGCEEYERNSIEKIQNEAARIVTGLTRSVSLDNLSREVGWQLLSARRKAQKLSIMYRASKNQLPSYVSNLIPPLVNNITGYNLRNQNDINIPNTRLEIYKRSFIPSATQLWNNTDPLIRQVDTIRQFKRASTQQLYNNYSVPPHFLEGCRFLSVMHARIRNNCSNLNSDLCNNHIRDNPYCSCNEVVEDAEHFFFQCTNYTEQRVTLRQSLHEFAPLNIAMLLKGTEEVNHERNNTIFKVVQDYIKSTKRFE